MQKTVGICLLWILILANNAAAEPFRTIVAGELTVSAENPEGSSLNLEYNSSAVIRIGGSARFIKGIELEITAPQRWLAHRGSLAMLMYSDFNRAPVTGVNDLDGKRIAYDPLPNKVKIVYQVPIRQGHGLRTSPYATVPTGVVAPSSFPVLLRLMTIIKGISDELENMQFRLHAKPVFSDEGAVKFTPRFPDQLRGRPFTVLVNDIVIENINEEQVFKEGEHHLVVLSEDYRNISRRFIVEKSKILELIINLQDPTPLLLFEAPENARIFLNNTLISRESGPVPVEPGFHEAKFQVGDYTLTKNITVERGKTYRIALSVGIDVEEHN